MTEDDYCCPLCGRHGPKGECSGVVLRDDLPDHRPTRAQVDEDLAAFTEALRQLEPADERRPFIAERVASLTTLRDSLSDGDVDLEPLRPGEHEPVKRVPLSRRQDDDQTFVPPACVPPGYVTTGPDGRPLDWPEPDPALPPAPQGAPTHRPPDLPRDSAFFGGQA